MNKSQKFLTKELNTIHIHKMHAILTYDGLKPSMIFGYSKKDNLNFKFKELGIHGLMKYYKHKNDKNPVCYIAKNEFYLEKIIKSFENVFFRVNKYSNRLMDPEFYSWSYELGSVLGYPETSILAYLNQFKNNLTKNIIPQPYQSDLTSFVNRKERRIIKVLMPGTVSKENYHNERLTGLMWEKHIIKNYPGLYFEFFKDEIVNKFKRNFKFNIFNNH